MYVGRAQTETPTAPVSCFSLDIHQVLTQPPWEVLPIPASPVQATATNLTGLRKAAVGSCRVYVTCTATRLI